MMEASQLQNVASPTPPSTTTTKTTGNQNGNGGYDGGVSTTKRCQPYAPLNYNYKNYREPEWKW